MPLYSFRLDVPASPDVVAERLRVVCRGRPGFRESLRSFWMRTNPSGPPFLGSVKGNSFNLRRNINHRNSFLPRIHGRIDSVKNGPRVRIVMFMHPLVFLFTLFWLGSAGSTAWREFGANSALPYIPLMMFIFGLALSMGGFFAEAAKAKHLLSAALFDSAISTAAQPAVPQTDASLLYSEKSRSHLLEVALAVCLLFLANSVFKQYTNRLRAVRPLQLLWQSYPRQTRRLPRLESPSRPDHLSVASFTKRVSRDMPCFRSRLTGLTGC
jgi:hypothetical protein